MIYKAKIEGSSGYLYILAEHQSLNDKYIGPRFLKYNASIMRDHMQQYKTDKSPIIINILVYAEKDPYKCLRTYSEMFEDFKLASEIIFKDFHLIDPQSKKVDELSKDEKASVAEILLKQGIKRDISKFLEDNIEILKLLIKRSRI